MGSPGHCASAFFNPEYNPKINNKIEKTKQMGSFEKILPTRKNDVKKYFEHSNFNSSKAVR